MQRRVYRLGYRVRKIRLENVFIIDFILRSLFVPFTNVHLNIKFHQNGWITLHYLFYQNGWINLKIFFLFLLVFGPLQLVSLQFIQCNVAGFYEPTILKFTLPFAGLQHIFSTILSP